MKKVLHIKNQRKFLDKTAANDLMMPPANADLTPRNKQLRGGREGGSVGSVSQTLLPVVTKGELRRGLMEREGFHY